MTYGFDIAEFSAGVFDLEKLTTCKELPDSSFCPLQFIRKTLHWGVPVSREPHTYALNTIIEIFDPAEKLAKLLDDRWEKEGKIVVGPKEFSFNKKIQWYCLKYAGLTPLFCVHTSYDGGFHHYVDQIIDYLHFQPTRRKKLFPKILVISERSDTASIICTHFHQKKKNIRGGVLFLDSMQKNNEEKNISIFYSEIVIGSFNNVTSYFETANHLDILEDLKSSLKIIIIEEVQVFESNPLYLEHVSNLLFQFTTNLPRVMFFVNSCSSTSLSSVKLKCEALTSRQTPMIFEKISYQKMYSYIKIEFIVPVDIFQSELFLYSNSEEFSKDNLSKTSKIMTKKMQKLYRCTYIIKNLQEKREKENLKRANSKNEKILVITNTIFDANFVALMLKSQNLHLKVDVLTSNDSTVQTEIINFHFREKICDVLVIDWRSINDIQRGIVDSVIFFDFPEQNYLQTLLEYQIEKLVSRNMIQVKLHIMFDENIDSWAVKKLIILLWKYKQKIPLKFKHIYELQNKI